MIRWTETGSELMVGLSRSGKSMFALYKMIQFFLAGYRFGLLEPKGDNFPKLIAWMAATAKGQDSIAATGRIL